MSLDHQGHRTDKNAALQQVLQKVASSFLSELPDRSRQLEEHEAALAAHRISAEAIDEIRRQAHKINGIAATVGFPDLSIEAAKTEAVFEKALNQDTTWSELADALGSLIDSISEVLAGKGP